MKVIEHGSRMRHSTFRRMIWTAFARLCTLLIPDLVLRYVGGLTTIASRQAWREKITMAIIFVSLSACLCIWLEYISTLFCDFEEALDFDYVYSNRSTLVGINGSAYNWSHVDFSTGSEADMVAEVKNYPHQDLSDLFPTFQLLMRPQGVEQYADNAIQACIGDQNKTAHADRWLKYRLANDPAYYVENNKLISCPLPNQRNTTGARCFNTHLPEFSGKGLKGKITFDPAEVASNYSALPSAGNKTNRGYVILDGTVLDVTPYLLAATNVVNVSATMRSRAFALDRMFLPLDLTILLYVHLGEDITPYFAGNASGNPELYRLCLQTLFFKGVTNDGITAGCAYINPALWATMGIGLLYFLVKMNLANLSRLSAFQSLFFSTVRQHLSEPLQVWPYTLLMIPCFSEPAETLRQTFESLARTTYDDTRKMLLFMCDGVTRGAHDAKETHVNILESLGYSCTEDPIPLAYHSLGQHRRRVNYAKVYSGYYETGRNRVPYLVVVKIGGPDEGKSQGDGYARPPGNRGKRDSLVMILSFLERCMDLRNHLMTPFEYELFNQCYSVLGIDPRWFKYLLVVNAHTQVQGEVVQKFVLRLEKDSRLLAISGHVRPANPEESLTTMLQIYPHYMAFFSSLAYEACLQSVMSVNSGFVMYKLWADDFKVVEQLESEKWRSQRLCSDTTSQQAIGTPWPKADDDAESQWSDDEEEDNDEDTKTNQVDRQRFSAMSGTGALEGRLSLSAVRGRKPYCIHPTVLRGIASAAVDTMHMKSVLLLGEDRYLSIVLLKSHPRHRLGFEPEAIGYAMFPTHFLSLQSMQSRNIRAAFHNLLEMHQAAWHIGLSYWTLSLAELLDMIFSVPITVYLYNIFIRAILGKGLAYLIIACSFSGLIVLHIFYFMVRRQFKYVFWFVLYCLFSVPLFAIWFPLVALWQTNDADRWNDLWPTPLNHSRWTSRLHGILDEAEQEPAHIQRKDSNCEIESVEKTQTELHGMVVSRMRLAEYELAEARKLHLAAEQALDSKFMGFSSMHSPSVSSFVQMEDVNLSRIKPLAIQARDGITSATMAATSGFQLSDRYASQDVTRRFNTKEASEGRGTLRRCHIDLQPASINPFEDTQTTMTVDNPFDDVHATIKNDILTYRKRHKASRSQSSYSTAISNKSSTVHLVEGSTLLGSANSSGFSHAIQPALQKHVPETVSVPKEPSHQTIGLSSNDRSSMFSIASHTHSLASSSLSLDPEAALEANTCFQAGEPAEESENDEGRNAALHVRVGLRFPNPQVGVTGIQNFIRSTRREASTPTAVTGPKKANEDGDEGTEEEDDDGMQSEARQRDGNLATLLRIEINNFLAKADLDLTTRSEVKEHLFRIFGQHIENEDTQTLIHEYIEEMTLEHLAK